MAIGENPNNNSTENIVDSLKNGINGNGWDKFLSYSKEFLENIEEKGFLESVKMLFQGKKEARIELAQEIEHASEYEGLRFFDGFTSFAAERNPETGVTLCSKTARLNLEKLVQGSEEIADGGSAKEAYIKAGSPKNNVEELIARPGVNVVDLYLDASERNKEYGHRIAAARTQDGFMVFDPYYNIGNGREGVPIDQYIKHMKEVKGREIWGGKAYA